MELLDNYLKAVRGHLAVPDQDDIVRELKANIRAEMEEKEAELGRPLHEAEQRAILERHGDPLRVAGRYRSETRSLAFGRQLIGPDLFPLYLKVLCINAGLLVLVVAVFALSTGEPITLPMLVLELAVQLVVVTLVFVLLEASRRKSGGPRALIDKYLRAIRDLLPKGQQDDVVAELRDNLLSQMEEREKELGRPLQEAEQEAILTRHGHPIVVAGRYRPEQRSLTFGRQLIGPALFPIYSRILAINVGITLTVCIGIALALARRHPLLHLLPGALLPVFIQFGILTLVFVMVELSAARFPQGWAQPNWPLPKRDGQRVPRVESVAQLLALAGFLAALKALRANAPEVFASATTGLVFAPVWGQIYLPIVLLTIGQMAQACVNLVRPEWIVFRSAVRAISGGVWLLIMGFVLRAGPWIVPANPTGMVAGDGHKFEVLNHYLFYALLVVALLSAVQFVVDVRRWIRDRRRTVS